MLSTILASWAKTTSVITLRGKEASLFACGATSLREGAATSLPSAVSPLAPGSEASLPAGVAGSLAVAAGSLDGCATDGCATPRWAGVAGSAVDAARFLGAWGNGDCAAAAKNEIRAKITISLTKRMDISPWETYCASSKTMWTSAAES